MSVQRICFVFLMGTLASAFAGCNRAPKDAPPAPAPAATLDHLLALHGLLGRGLEERPEAFKKAPVDRKALEKWVLDYSEVDPFLADLYVGFVVGVTASNRHSAETAVRGQRAEVKMGKARIVLYLRDDVWQVSLAESIPDEIKARAKTEKLRVAQNAQTAVR